MRSLAKLTLLAALPAGLAGAQAGGADPAADPRRWLEDVNGERAMSWVRAENAKTTAVLEKDPRYAAIYGAALSMASAKDRIPYVTFIAGALYNFWQDSAHVRGLWRKTSLASYRTASPTWTTVLDLDALAKKEKANWVWHGASCARPEDKRCLLSLSDGGEDATTVREFDLLTQRFVPGGFSLPKGKQTAAWSGTDTLFVAREWTAGEMTASGYPFVVKRLARGQALSSAVEIFRGKPTDVRVTAETVDDMQGHRVSLIGRATSFFEVEYSIIRPRDVVRIAIPRKSYVADMIDGQVVVKLSEDWAAGGTVIHGGGLAAFDAAAALRDPAQLKPVAVYEPGPRESVSGVSATHDRLMVGITQNVKGRVLVFTRSATGAWTQTAITLPDNVSTDIVSTDSKSNRAFISVAGYLTPSSVWLADAASATAAAVKSLAPRFDASKSVVEQFEAVSKDSTRVPYFIVHPKGMTLDGSHPTILYAYGGFEVSLTPSYDADVGKLWLEQGGVYVVANIRGGGEFGPAWHEAGLKTHRQVIYDDFAAVAQDLIARGVTSSKKLGIQGGSNGGLLMGVQMTQHPELWGAVDIQVPLLDMLRYEQIAAGASWVGEYGSVSIPEQRDFLASISPYNNLKAGITYPKPLIWTTTKDDRVGPQHARKFAAKMSDMGLPYLFYEVIEGGHGAGANIEQRAHTSALEFTYFAQQLMGAGATTVP
jgi:prolyl oligopeptidase